VRLEPQTQSAHKGQVHLFQVQESPQLHLLVAVMVVVNLVLVAVLAVQVVQVAVLVRVPIQAVLLPLQDKVLLVVQAHQVVQMVALEVVVLAQQQQL
jgi:hypothetical protein